jgi:ribulose-bisphosphate carboxylase large chain
MDSLLATYRLRCPPAEAPTIAREIALEQTVEVAAELVTDPRIANEIVGRVLEVRPSEDGAVVRIAYNAELARPHAGQLWNLLYGNISLKRGIRLVDVSFPASLHAVLPGPKLGIDGLRRRLGVHGRPLLATALKPRGSSPEQLAELAYQFALGGGDFVKDDHNLVDADFDDFRRRVELCQAAVERAAAETGRPCLYAPNLSPSAFELPRYIEFLRGSGVEAVLLAPLLLGFDTVRRLAMETPWFLMAHPTFCGSFFHDPDHGVAPEILLGQFFRGLGCDSVIFPNQGGRFAFSAAECQAIATAAHGPSDLWSPAWPAPAGGMTYERLPEMGRTFGSEAIFLIGGALLAGGTSLVETTRQFQARIADTFPAATHAAPAPLAATPSSCELPPMARPIAAPLLERLAFQTGFRWDGRSPTAYKQNAELPFAGVSRTELIGTSGERTAFDVRYFEIAAGGYSSREKHGHTHVIIGLRGVGELQLTDRVIPVAPHDIAYVAPWEVHQLKTVGAEPFGFLCIVDHDRDRPQAP